LYLKHFNKIPHELIAEITGVSPNTIDTVSHDFITVCNNGYINAKSVCELITKIHEQNIGLPITIVLDNARYQQCILVQNYANELNIELLFLPSYNPQLNLIEGLWK